MEAGQVLSGAAMDVRVRVANATDMFAAPPLDPFNGEVESRSGFERATEAIGAARPGTVSRLVVELRSGEAPDGLEAAVHAMAAARAEEMRRQLARTGREGRAALLLGLGFLAVCMVLSAALRTDGLPFAFARQVLGEGLGIAGWVALWRPIELLLYDNWPLRRALRIYERMAALPVVAARAEAA